MNRRPSLVAFLAVLVAVGAALRPGAFGTGDPPAPRAPAPAPGGAADPAAEVLVVAEGECAQAAYLCQGILDREPARVLRWPDGTVTLRVRVLLPEAEDPGRARTLQQAAARGIRAWQGQPFGLRIELDERGGQPDVVVGWVSTLGGTELGRVRSRWNPDAPATFVIDEFVLATRNPLDPAVPLPLSAVELAAAHEMGHALGLPHSENPGDLMYHSNTATRLSVDDYRAVEGLYRLPDGAYLTRTPR